MFVTDHARTLRVTTALLIGVLVGCSQDLSGPPARHGNQAPAFSRTSTANASISSVSPDTASLSTTLNVQVSGGGFASGMVVVWQLNGVADSTQIKTNSVQLVSSKLLVANVTISGSATAAKWDVALYSGGKTGIGTELSVLKQAFNVLDPRATWLLPLSDAGLAFQSDHRYSDGTYSVYSDGVCNVAAKIFATTDASNSGDATVNTTPSGGGKGTANCQRLFTLAYPDGYTETLSDFSNLREIENTSYSIPIGTTVERQLHIHLGSTTKTNSSRCDGLLFGYGVASGLGIGSDSVLVTRVDASTWHVVSQPAPHTLAYCKNDGQLYAMPVDFVVVSSYPLP